MTFLPIVGRELRVAARKWPTYWSRVIAAGVALIIFFGMIVMDLASGSGMRGQLGSYVFQTLSWMCFACVCAAGVFLTSDALSEEKREGTLGLLFLTDLRGFDVVLGKLMASSLRGVFGLVAAFPVIGLSFLLGGMSGQEFWRLTLVLCNTLFFTLSIGICVSSVSRQGQRAMFGTAGICFVFIALTWLVDWAIAEWEITKFVKRLSLVSPANALLELRSAGRFGTFWTTMAWVHGIGWVFLIAACVLAPRAWQEKAVRGVKPKRRWRLGSPEKRAAWRRRLIEVNPVRWLAGRDTWLAGVSAAVAGVALVVGVGIATGLSNWDVGMTLVQVMSWILSVVLGLSVASHASKFFVEATQCGALELMLATPLPAQDIVRGQWWALRRAFLVPVLLVLAVRLTAEIAQLVQMWKVTQVSPPAAAGTAVAVAWQNDYFVHQCITLGLGTVGFFTGLLALAWFGMWMGVTTRKANAAVAKTIVFVSVLPTFVLMFLAGIFTAVYFAIGGATGGAGGLPYWVQAVVTSAFGIGLDLMFFFIAWRKLGRNFRETVARAAGLAVWRRPVPPPAARPPQSAPPPLPA